MPNEHESGTILVKPAATPTPKGEHVQLSKIKCKAGELSIPRLLISVDMQ